MSYNVPQFFFFGGGEGGVDEILGGKEKKDSLPILGLQRLASLSIAYGKI